MKKFTNTILTLIANIPIYVAGLFGFVIRVLSFFGSVFLAIGLEAHKHLKTDIGVKLIEADKIVKKVTAYVDKAAKASENAAASSTPKATQESLRLVNIIKNSGDNGSSES